VFLRDKKAAGIVNKYRHKHESEKLWTAVSIEEETEAEQNQVPELSETPWNYKIYDKKRGQKEKEKADTGKNHNFLPF
jgi:hypothetical protein